MRVFWLTHIAPPEIAAVFNRSAGAGGGWIHALAEALRGRPEVDLGIGLTAPGGTWRRADAGRVTAYHIPVRRQAFRTSVLDSETVEAVRRAIGDFRPDLVHIHGTEYFHGLLAARGVIGVPSLVSIQGILDACEREYYGGLSGWELFRCRTLRDWVRRDGLFEQRRRMRRRAAREREILGGNPNFAGRTAWDRAYVLRANPTARYYEVGEILRRPFYEASWTRRSAVPHTIFCSSAAYPLKGFHVLLKAAASLVRDFPDLQVRVPVEPFLDASFRNFRGWRARGYTRYLQSLVRKLHLESHVVPAGRLTAEQFAGELARAHVFALPSFIENSPNSLAESLMVGTPAVASFVGGVPSMVEHGRTALCVPPGDEIALADQIRRVFNDDELAGSLSSAARQVALARHSPDSVVGQLLGAYKALICSSERNELLPEAAAL